jgi:uncharacterized protein YcnI
MKYAFVLLLPIILCAHAIVAPSASRTGAYERYVLRVPNESDGPTIRVEIRFPTEVRVISFADVPGWALKTATDSTGRATYAVWTGSLPPERFVEFPFVAVNPTSPTRITWPVTQVYADGQIVNWSGPRDSERPASITEVSNSGTWPLWLPTVLAAFALLVATISAALSLRSRVAPRSSVT